jgi:hypothetical protein
VRRVRARRGIALVAALTLMTLIAVLVVGGVASSTLAQRNSRLSRTDVELTAATDFAINTVLADPAAFQLATIPFGQPRTFGVASSADGVRTELSVTRLPGGVLWIVADGARAGLDEGHRRFNVVARFPVIGPIPAAALTSRGAVSVGGNVAFLPDTTRDADCQLPPAADLIVAPSSLVTTVGSVRIAHRAEADDSSTYFLTQGQLDALRLGVGVTRVRGDTTIAGGSYSGILIVDGNLTIAGPYSLDGMLIVRGRIAARSGGFSLIGAMLVYGGGPGAQMSAEIDGAIVRYSRCTIERVLRIALPPRPASQRGWAEFF